MERGKGIPKKSRVRKLIRYFVALLLGFLLIHSIFNLVCSYELARALREAKSSGTKVELSEIIPLPVPKEENAALIYEQAFALMDKLETKYHKEWKSIPFMGKIPLDKLTIEQKKSIAELLEKQDFLAFYNLIEKAANFSTCRFELKYGRDIPIFLPHLAKMRQVERLIAARTHILTEKKRYNEASKSAQVGLRLGDALTNEPTLISQLVRIAIDSIAMNSLEATLNAGTEEVSIQDYQELISLIEKKKGLTQGLEGEIPLTMAGLFSKVLKGKVKIKKYEREPHTLLTVIGCLIIDSKLEGEELELFIRPDVNLPLRLSWKAYMSYLGRPIAKRDIAFFLRFSTQAIKLSRLPYYAARADLATLVEETPARFDSIEYPLSGFYWQPAQPILTKQAMYLARLGALRIALALKIYKERIGDYPDKLTQLAPNIIPELPVDPFTGKEYIYRTEEEGFIVYSVGKNMKDDGGLDDELYPWTKGDVVWRCTR